MEEQGLEVIRLMEVQEEDVIFLTAGEQKTSVRKITIKRVLLMLNNVWLLVYIPHM